MKPLNHDDKGCNFTSSDCVIWQGPDIPCIKLCKGDSVSDVVYKLATELCGVMETLDITNYDLSCLQLTGCAPDTFQEFIQVLIGIICDLQECCTANGGAGSRTIATISDTQIPTAPCFHYVNEFGDTVTTMTVTQYVTAIGNRICSLESRTSSLESTVSIHTDQINQINNELANPDPVVLPLVTPTCVLPATPTPMDAVLAALEQQYCELLGATGMPADIYNAIAKQCANLGTLPVLSGGAGNMAGIPGWNPTVVNLAGTVNNIWLTICDLRSAVQNIKINCCPGGCDEIVMNLQATLTGTNVNIFLTGNIPNGFVTCSPLGTLVTITDDNGGSMTAYMDIITFINNPTGFVISIASTPINSLSNLHIHMEPCVSNAATGATCQSCLNTDIINQVNCPAVLYNPTTDSISYTGTSLAGTAQYTVELWDNLGAALIASQVQIQTVPTPFTGTFNGLLPNTTYKLRTIVTINGVDTVCQFQVIALLPTVNPPIFLGGAGNFGILAGNGITNTSGVGTSSIIGDVGSDPTVAVIGINAGDVTGTLYTIASAAVQAAKIELLNAIADGTGRTPYITLGAANLGGSTIIPGYFDTPGGVVSLTGNVTFDAAGDPNAVFIINAPNGITTDPASTVTLINAAQAKNIFWISGTNVALGAGSFFKGIVLADNNITSGAGNAIEGRLLASAGSVTIDTNTITN